MDKLTVSASQIETFNDCRRKWAFDKIDHLPRTETESARLGSAVHDQLERWFKFGHKLDLQTKEGRIAAEMLHHYPPQSETAEWSFEGEFKIVLKGEEFDFTGKIDMLKAWGEIPQVWDHKTTSSIAQWAKPLAQLFRDPQAMLYAYYAIYCAGNEHAGEADLVWVYAQTPKGNPNEKRVLRVNKDHVKEQVEKLISVGREIVATHKNHKRALDVVANKNACSKFGGCSYIMQCQAPEIGVFKPTKTEIEMGSEMLNKIRVNRPGAIVQPAKAEKPAAVEINPPEQVYADDADEDFDEDVDLDTSAPAAVVDTLSEADLQAERDAAEAAAKATKTRKPRTPKAPPAHAPAAAVAPPVAMPAKPAPQAQASEDVQEVEPVNSALEGYVLYINCAPRDTVCTYDHDILNEAQKILAEQFGGNDYRLTEAGSYGRAPALLKAVIEEQVLSQVTEHVVIDTRNLETQGIMTILAANAKRVISGF